MIANSLSKSGSRFLPLIDDWNARTAAPVQRHVRGARREEQHAQFKFFDLLPELRWLVYEELFLFPAGSTLHDIFREAPWVVPALGVCTEMRSAGFHTIYTRCQLHLDIVSYQFASFEAIAARVSAPGSEANHLHNGGDDNDDDDDDISGGGLHHPILALDRHSLAVNPGSYDPKQFYDLPCAGAAPLPHSLFEHVRDARSVSLAVHLGLRRDDIEPLSMKVVFKLLHRITHVLMPDLERVRLRVGPGDFRRKVGGGGGGAGAGAGAGTGAGADGSGGGDGRCVFGLTAALLASASHEDLCCYFGGAKEAEARRARWLESLPGQIGRLPVKAWELQLDGVSDEVFEVIAGCATVSR